MKFWQYTVVFQEIPDEISLAFEITNCPYRCGECHSPHLQEDIGQELTLEGFTGIINKYIGLITTILFLGGEHYSEIKNFLECARAMGLKTALYTGGCEIDHELKAQLNYLKTGQFVPSLGGLDHPTTNQRLVNLDTGENILMTKRIPQTHNLPA